ncbi:D-cysteine desulfhydrase family protein [Caminicella sporogenes]|uniref:D-cysteine desulfhydrase family protein n=1 Tax=Caminicella sporogenes TaxID=166485 RepID=UPI0025404AAB|nr:D-cysteine desulfhydrase family protein [Caminicella sporogenes]WIF95061.1 D-cysteine desulfhydrase family protein [Caminicella sporogenes]
MYKISNFKRKKLGIFPTPFKKLQNLSSKFNVNLFIKRDDLSGVGVGGNKIRKLEFLLADAIDKGCDTVITIGGAQSNHAMLTAASCRKLHLEPILVLKKRGVTDTKGNLLLNNILDAKIYFIDTDSTSEVYDEAIKLSEELMKKGKKPYVIPMGGSNILGTLGYINCAFELFKQADEIGVNIDHIVCASGSGGTQGGIIAGVKLLDKKTKVTGVMVSPEKDFEKKISNLVNGALKLLESDICINEKEVVLKDYVGLGYAIPSEIGTQAIKLLAKNEGIILDPVYTGKAFGGLIDLIERGYIRENENVVFIHTGGIPGLFAIH